MTIGTPGIGLPQQPHILGPDRLGKRTAGARVRDEHGLFRVQQFRGLGHEMHAGQDDHIRIGGHRFPRKSETVADEIGDAMKNLRRLIIMRKHHRVAGPLQRHDGVDVLRMDRPLNRRDRMAHLRVERLRVREFSLEPFPNPAMPFSYTPTEYYRNICWC